VLATFNNPFVEFTLAFDVVRFNRLPVVKPFAVRPNRLCVVAVDQFQICPKFKLSIVLVAPAAVNEDIGPAAVMAAHEKAPVTIE